MMKKLVLFFAAAALFAQPFGTISAVTVSVAPPLLFGCESMARGVCVPTYLLTIPRPADPLVVAVRYKVSAVIDSGLSTYVSGAVIVPAIGSPSVKFTLGGSASGFTVETAELTAISESAATIPLDAGVAAR